MLHSLVVLVSALPARPEDYQKKQEKGVRSLDMLLPLLLVLALKVVWYWREIGDKSNFIFVVNAIANMWRQLLVLILIIKPLLSEPAGKIDRKKRQTQVLSFMHATSWSRDEFKVFLSLSWFFVHQATSKCIDYEYAGFHCVPIYQCNNEGVIRIQGLGLLDPKRRGRC